MKNITNVLQGFFDAQVNSAEDTVQSWPQQDSATFSMQEFVPGTQVEQYPPNVAFSVLQDMGFEDPLESGYL